MVNGEHTNPVESRTEEHSVAWAKSNGTEPVYPGQPLGASGEPIAEYYYGLTKRELFAAMALQAVITNDHQNIGYETGAGHAVKYADALLKELAK